MLKPLVAGNWKMNGLRSSDTEIQMIKDASGRDNLTESVDMMICPPATLIREFSILAENSGLLIGAQDCHTGEFGAHTGDISAAMLHDAGAVAVIVGHSERRTDHGESNELVREKGVAACNAGLISIVCIGESEDERKSGKTLDVIGQQLKNSLPADSGSKQTIIAYEPIWAIGTGLTPTTSDIEEVHSSIRETLVELVGSDQAAEFRLLYGGSVKPANAKELMSINNVNGALVGGASLKANDFLGIVSACSAAA